MHHLIRAEYTFCSSAHQTFTEIDHTLDHKMSLNKFKRSQVIQNYVLWPQQNEIRNQYTDLQKTPKYLKTKLHT